MKKPWDSKTEPVEPLIRVDPTPSPKDEARASFSYEAEFKKFRNHDLRSDIKLKRAYFSVTRKITRIWVGFIMGASSLQFLARLFGSGLESAEFIALITTTTATLVGFWAIVGRYLFPADKKSKTDRGSK